MLDDQDDKQHNLDDTAQSGLDQDPRDLGHLPGEFLAREPQQIRRGNHAQVRRGKHPLVQGGTMLAGQEVQDHGHQHEWPENIDHHRHSGRAAEEDAQKRDRVDSRAARLALVVD